jgi:hypothetical protein
MDREIRAPHVGGDASSCDVRPKDLGEEATHHGGGGGIAKKNTGLHDLNVAHSVGAPSHDELAHDARVSNLFPASRRSVVGHRNLAAVEPKKRGTLAAVPHHGDWHTSMRFVRPMENMGPRTSSWQCPDQRWTEELGRPLNHGESGGGGTLAVAGDEWGVGPWACIGVFIYDPWFSKINSSLALATFQKLQKGPRNFFCHIFVTVTLISVILVPKFLESLPLSFYTFINTCLLHID